MYMYPPGVAGAAAGHCYATGEGGTASGIEQGGFGTQAMKFPDAKRGRCLGSPATRREPGMPPGALGWHAGRRLLSALLLLLLLLL